MRSLTIRLPDDDLARSRGQSMNKLIEELSAQALAAWDTENHFLAQLDLVAIRQRVEPIGFNSRIQQHLSELFLQLLANGITQLFSTPSVPAHQTQGYRSSSATFTR